MLKIRKETVLLTAYYPTHKGRHSAAEQALEGGDDDRRGFPIEARAVNDDDDRRIAFTVQEVARGRAPFVAVSMAPRQGAIGPEDGPAYGTPARCPELERRVAAALGLERCPPITLLVVDTGQAFEGQGYHRADILFDDNKSGCAIVGNMTPMEIFFMEDDGQ